MPVEFDKDSLGERLARIRKERGLTQNQIAAHTGLTQVLVSDYERGRLRLTADMVVRFAVALGITTDELLRPKPHKTAPPRKISRKVLQRLERIEALPPYKQPCSPPLTASSGLCDKRREERLWPTPKTAPTN